MAFVEVRGEYWALCPFRRNPERKRFPDDIDHAHRKVSSYIPQEGMVYSVDPDGRLIDQSSTAHFILPLNRYKWNTKESRHRTECITKEANEYLLVTPLTCLVSGWAPN